MQDGAPCRTARSVKSFLHEQNIPLLSWLGNSPDMNPIENVWELVKREMAKDMIPSKQQLIAKLIEVWNHNSKLQETVQECINSMPRRIKALIDAKGGQQNIEIKGDFFGKTDMSINIGLFLPVLYIYYPQLF